MFRKKLGFLLVGVLTASLGVGHGDLASLNYNFKEKQIKKYSSKEWKVNKLEKVKYPVDYNMRKWKDFQTHNEMIDACNVPESILDKMSTDEVIDLVMDYPLLCDIYAYDTLNQGLEALCEQNLAFEELFSREDGASMLLEYYKKFEISENTAIPAELLEEDFDEIIDEVSEKEELNEMILEDSEELTNEVTLETLLAQEEVLNNLSDMEKEELNKEAIKKLEEKSQSDLYKGLESVFYDTIQECSNEDKIGNYKLCKKTDNTDDFVYGCADYYVKTPKGTKVKVEKYTFFGDATAISITNQYRNAYPKATLLLPATNVFNCHSYAWYSQSQTMSSGYWMNNPEAYVSDKSYKLVGNSPTANNQKVAYHKIPHKVGLQHSGIVVSYSTRTIKSKWGQAPLMKHKVDYSPYTNCNILYYKKS